MIKRRHRVLSPYANQPLIEFVLIHKQMSETKWKNQNKKRSINFQLTFPQTAQPLQPSAST